MKAEQIEYLLELWMQETITEQQLEQLKALIIANSDTELAGKIAAMIPEDASYTGARHSTAEKEVFSTAILSFDKIRTNNNFVTECKLPPDALQSIVTTPELAKTTASAAPGSVRVLSSWLWKAAIILLIAGSGIFTLLYINKNDPEKSNLAPVALFNKGAQLTLADGSTLLLDSLNDGVIAQQNGTDILYNNGQIHYQPSAELNQAITYNTISTPKGSQFFLSLSDGTKVWLNAASKITFPARFFGTERKVIVQGEAYFEVAENKNAPFRVSLNNTATIEVLGTSFNIAAYGDDSITRTTLLSGSVKVTRSTGLGKTASTILKPNQQGFYNTSSSKNYNAAIQVQPIDALKVIAWKNGFFNFDKMDLYAVMKQLERWYDIEVEYKTGASDRVFYGEISRTMSLDGVLKALEMFHIKYQLEGKKLIITP